MAGIALTGGFYQAKSIIANAQRCLNLYPEENPKVSQSPVPVTHYQTPGLNLKSAGPLSATSRCLYRASNGDLYEVIGANVYYVNSLFDYTLLGSIADGTTIVSMADNGLAIVVVDGTPSGYAIDMQTRAFGAIVNASFYGADRADYVDTFFLFNRPGTNQFYISLSNANYAMLTGGTGFDPLDIAAKIGYPDPIVSLIVMHREVWLIGALTTEIWYNSGAADFPFERMPGAFVEHGCIAKYSVVKQDLSIYWLSQDLQGQIIVLMGNSYNALRISTHAIENEFAKYSTVSDAIGFIYQQEGHVFYVLTFPTADKTWVYDQATQLWHERAYTDNNGDLHRIRPNCCANAYGYNLVGDWQDGKLYSFDLNKYTDNGQPISRIRSFPHIVNDGKRIYYSQFIADMAVGEDGGTLTSNPPVVALRWSDDRGASYGNRIEQSLGSAGQYLTSVQFQRLGYARDRIFELSWSGDFKTALNGAWFQATPGQT